MNTPIEKDEPPLLIYRTKYKNKRYIVYCIIVCVNALQFTVPRIHTHIKPHITLLSEEMFHSSGVPSSSIDNNSESKYCPALAYSLSL